MSPFRSSVFRAMFQHDMRESKSNEIIIPDLDFNTVKDMVRYVYSGRWNRGLEITFFFFGLLDSLWLQGEWPSRQVWPSSECCRQVWHQVCSLSWTYCLSSFWIRIFLLIFMTCEYFPIRDLKEECCQSLSTNLAVDQVILSVGTWVIFGVKTCSERFNGFLLYRWLTFWSSPTYTRLLSWKPQLYHFYLPTKRRSSVNLTGRLSWRLVVFTYFISSKLISQGHPDLLLEVLESSVESRGLPPPRLINSLLFASLPWIMLF